MTRVCYASAPSRLPGFSFSGQGQGWIYRRAVREGGRPESCFLDSAPMIGGHAGNTAVEKMIPPGFFGVCACVSGRLVAMGETPLSRAGMVWHGVEALEANCSHLVATSVPEVGERACRACRACGSLCKHQPN